MEDIELIYKRYYRNIYNLAYRMTGSHDDASDLTQETFIDALSSLDSFRGESQVYTWLYTIAKNKCLKLLKKRDKSNLSSLQELIEKASSPVYEEISEEEKSMYIAQVKDGCLSGILRCLSLQQRLAFIFSVILYLPVNEVALILGKSENATRILIHRSRQAVREFLCNNCSLYDLTNTCRCENLINFSLKKGWINASETHQAEREIKDLKSEVTLYQTLQQVTPNETSYQIKQLLANRKHQLIFTDKKVK